MRISEPRSGAGPSPAVGVARVMAVRPRFMFAGQGVRDPFGHGHVRQLVVHFRDEGRNVASLHVAGHLLAAQAAFMLTDFAEVVLVAVLLKLFFFGGWQFPWLYQDGFHLGAHAIELPRAVVVILGVLAFWFKVVGFCWLQILVRWTLPRFRYDQLMRLGWKGLVPLGLLNVLITAFVVVAANGVAR